MSTTIKVGVLFDPDTDKQFDAWAKQEGRSKRRQAFVLLRRLTSLRETHRDELERLGLVERREQSAG